ncbi:MAG TPA: isoleucine--tRNA ligase [Candidatus Saccharimonadales bacterium]|nr:isoleucine--tRNA ligase [Candidatus Saccharimonadales bacterium]
MKFQAGKRRKAIEYEKDLVVQWKRNKTFEKSVESRPAENGYVFYDGPPFITGVPHHGTLLSSIAKDVVPRYWTMQGKRVERVWGWDCHGLPAEVFTEKKLGVQDRRDIGTKISLEEYITTCRDNMVQTGNLWEDTIERVGRWVDFKGAYRTMDKNYMESVWWAFKQLYEKGKIYEGEKVLLYCTRDATPLSKAEVTMDAGSYKDVVDPSVYVKFKLVGENRSVLAWTTTPWTLPANTAVAVNKDFDYSEVELEDGSHVILATELLERVLTDEKHKAVPFKLVGSLKGTDLVGKRYEPLFEDRGEKAHQIWHADYVAQEEGTGIVHLAPAYGEEDYALSRAMGFPFVSVIDGNGFYDQGEWKGQNVWDANKPIAKELHARGVVWKIDYITHSYPHCYRCGTRLMYRAHPSWFVDIDGQRQLMLDENENVSWFPEHLKHGRFQKTVESAPDWNISRDRFWATAMPVWKGVDADGKEHVKVVGSYDELKVLSGRELDDYHRPWVDDIVFTIDGVEYKRIDKVLDCWFESGSMPFAQFHYPFENVEKFEANYPGDYIVEYVSQVRAWFYYVHAVNVGLFGKYAYKHVNVTGTLAGNDGRKMSKSYGNYTDPNQLMDSYSADALRFLLMSSPLMNGEDFALQDKDVQDIQRKLAMIWNMYDFFTLYASVDGWNSSQSVTEPILSDFKNPLDVWVLSRLHQLQAHITEHMDAYDIPGALEPVMAFVDDASNWYVRRSRRRFWKSGDDSDKNEAYQTLYYVLLRLSVILAPFVPFLAEELYLKLTGGEAGESVHLLDWPKAGAVDENLVQKMIQVREAINFGLAQRAQAHLKVRQPLAGVTVSGVSELSREFVEIIAEELNVKNVALVAVETQGVRHLSVTLDTDLTPELGREGLMRELVRQVQSARKGAGLNVDDRIVLAIVSGEPEVQQALTEHAETIKAETLAVSLNESTPEAYGVDLTVDGYPVAINLAKA